MRSISSFTGDEGAAGRWAHRDRKGWAASAQPASARDRLRRAELSPREWLTARIGEFAAEIFHNARSVV